METPIFWPWYEQSEFPCGLVLGRMNMNTYILDQGLGDDLMGRGEESEELRKVACYQAAMKSTRRRRLPTKKQGRFWVTTNIGVEGEQNYRSKHWEHKNQYWAECVCVACSRGQQITSLSIRMLCDVMWCVFSMSSPEKSVDILESSWNHLGICWFAVLCPSA